MNAALREHLAETALLYAPSVEDFCSALPDIGAALSIAFTELCAGPTQSGTEQLLIQLDGARRHLLRMHESMRRAA